MVAAMVNSEARVFAEQARRNSRSFSSNTGRNRTPTKQPRPSDVAILKSGVTANDLASRLQRHKVKTEAKLEKERQSKIQKELEAMSQPHIN